MPKKLKLWNGRGCYTKSRTIEDKSKFVDHIYICAYSQADVLILCAEAGVPMSLTELRNYYSAGCWGRTMDGITPERGIWAQESHNSKPVRLV